VGRKTVTVSLSRAQYEALNEAVKNERTLWKIVGEMERLSRRILFGDPARHPPTQTPHQESFRPKLSAIAKEGCPVEAIGDNGA
jgi:hypothetical protein